VVEICVCTGSVLGRQVGLRTIDKSCTTSLYVRTPLPSHPCVSLMSNSRFIGEHVYLTRSRRTMFRACTPCSLVFGRGVSDPDGPVQSRRAGQRKRRGRARMTYVVHVMWFSCLAEYSSCFAECWQHFANVSYRPPDKALKKGLYPMYFWGAPSP
jgi:hypothetical protein